MSPRIVFVALSVALMGAVASAPGVAQTPEQSPEAKAAPQAKSESATRASTARPEPAVTAHTFSARRSDTDATGGKATLTQPSAR
jgi:hypothetical protein